jgi:hypothetical protein
VSRHGHAFIDRALYLPKGWTDDPARLKATYVPGDIGFSLATAHNYLGEPELTLAEVKRRCGSVRMTLGRPISILTTPSRTPY